jgi:predicted RNA-binding Zn ribbon-like protein
VPLGRRNLHSIATLQLVGGALCLDLVNTTGARASRSPRERLLSYGDLLTWSLRTRVLTPGDVELLRSVSATRVAESEAVLGRARALREELYQLFRSIAEGREPSIDSVARLGGYWRQDRSRRDLVWEGGGYALRLQVSKDDLDPMLWPVIASAVDLLTSQRLALLKRCGECDWLFADESRNGSRIWCKKECGDRARARRHYAQNRRTGGAPR